MVGIWDQYLSQQVQMNPNLTLEQTKITIRQKEACQPAARDVEGQIRSAPYNDLEDSKYTCRNQRVCHHVPNYLKIVHIVERVNTREINLLPEMLPAINVTNEATTAACACQRKLQV